MAQTINEIASNATIASAMDVSLRLWGVRPESDLSSDTRVGHRWHTIEFTLTSHSLVSGL